MRNLFLTTAAMAMAFGATAVSGQDRTSPTNAPNATNANNPSAPSNRDMTSQQRSAYDGWPADKQASYDMWPVEYQAYFWSLSPSQQTGWFALTDDQRKQVYEMPPASRAAAWASIEQQLAGNTDAAAPPSAATGMSSMPSTGATDPMDSPMDSDAAAPPEQMQANPVGSTQAVDPSPDPASAGASVAPTMPADPSYNAGPYKGALSAPPAEAMNKEYPKCTRTLQDSCRNPGGI